MTHTPGPWHVWAANNRLWDDPNARHHHGRSADAPGRPLEYMEVRPIEYTGPQGGQYKGPFIAMCRRLPNARLIAAAPDLLEAAEARLAEWHADSRNFERLEPKSVKLARAALAKAKPNE